MGSFYIWAVEVFVEHGRPQPAAADVPEVQHHVGSRRVEREVFAEELNAGRLLVLPGDRVDCEAARQARLSNQV
jgi:hypothetical protein